MCEFCHKHGEGEKWYLKAKNYSEDLLSDLSRRKYIEEFFSHPGHLKTVLKQLKLFSKLPMFIKNAVSERISNRQKKIHFGQVVPIEDIEQIFEFVNSIVRLACICRHVTLGAEKRYCYGISMGVNGGKLAEIVKGSDSNFLTGPDAAGLETVSKEETLAAFREYEKEGLCHTVWTFKAPFIGGICNCNRVDCLAMRATVIHGVPVMFKAEYAAQSDDDLCTGCKQCMGVCPFAAIDYQLDDRKIAINPERCYGCGICRSVCPESAIILKDRNVLVCQGDSVPNALPPITTAT